MLFSRNTSSFVGTSLHGSQSLPGARFGLVLGLFGMAALGCSASDAADGTGGTGSGVDTTIDPVEGGQLPTEGANGQYCQELKVNFEPKTPTVYVLVDRSGSMKDEGFWEPLRTGLLGVIQNLQGDVRFGFGSYTGTSADSCSGLQDLGVIDINNYDAIASAYNALSPELNGETPTAGAVRQAAEVLKADESPGDRFILLVTDGNPDFCNNGEDVCAQDALIATLQDTYDAGIRTLVFGLEAKAFPIEAGTLDRYANAGNGTGVAWDKAVVDGNGKTDIEYQCGSDNWKSFGGGDGPAGSYAETSGPATAFSSVDPKALSDDVRTAVEGLKSCTFDLAASDVVVKAGQEGTGDIYVGDLETPIAGDQWTLDTSTQRLELLGDACNKWQQADVTDFFAGFPCESLEVIR